MISWGYGWKRQKEKQAPSEPPDGSIQGTYFHKTFELEYTLGRCFSSKGKAALTYHSIFFFSEEKKVRIRRLPHGQVGSQAASHFCVHCNNTRKFCHHLRVCIVAAKVTVPIVLLYFAFKKQHSSCHALHSSLTHPVPP